MAAQHFGTLPRTTVSKIKRLLAAKSRAIRLALILCLASTASLGQTAAEDRFVTAADADCPIGISATVEKNEHPLVAQRLQVTLTKWPSFAVVTSRITVHGIAAVPNSPKPSEITKNLDLNRIVDIRDLPPPATYCIPPPNKKKLLRIR